MLFRLFKPVRARPPSALVGAILLVAGCGGSKFVAGSAAGGSAGTNAGGTDNAGSAGAGADDSAGAGGTSSGGGNSAGAGNGGTSGSSAGATSNAGSGGKPATTCDCAAGSYCQQGTKTCHSCADFSVLEFAAPEKLATLSQTGNQRFPRPAGSGSDLFYRSGTDGTPALWYAPTPISGIGRMLFMPADSGVDSGPLFAPKFSPPQNFYFDRFDPTTKLRQIMYATWAAGKISTPVAVPMGAPLNGGNDDFSVAIAATPRRAYWMSSRNKLPAPELLWATFGAGATTPAALDVKVKAGAAGTCPRLGDDATPWVNAEGTLLLFRSESVNDNCKPNDSGAFDLFAAPLSGAGTPLGPAVALSSLNNTGGGSNETDPALSVDSCTIYFASDSGKGDYDLYSAVRN